jgi:hypothetical protein
MALGMMPTDTVTNSFNEIRDDAENLPGEPLEELLMYFERQWLVDIDIWNVSTTDTRTNNTCEGKSEITFILKSTSVVCH